MQSLSGRTGDGAGAKAASSALWGRGGASSGPRAWEEVLLVGEWDTGGLPLSPHWCGSEAGSLAGQPYPEAGRISPFLFVFLGQVPASQQHRGPHSAAVWPEAGLLLPEPLCSIPTTGSAGTATPSAVAEGGTGDCSAWASGRTSHEGQQEQSWSRLLLLPPRRFPAQGVPRACCRHPPSPAPTPTRLPWRDLKVQLALPSSGALDHCAHPQPSRPVPPAWRVPSPRSCPPYPFLGLMAAASHPQPNQAPACRVGFFGWGGCGGRRRQLGFWAASEHLPYPECWAGPGTPGLGSRGAPPHS